MICMCVCLYTYNTYMPPFACVTVPTAAVRMRLCGHVHLEMPGLRHFCTLCRVGRPQVLPFVCTYTAISVFLLLVYSISGVVFLGYFQVPACACAFVPVCVCVSV